jgi:acetyl esterase/lipase
MGQVSQLEDEEEKRSDLLPYVIRPVQDDSSRRYRRFREAFLGPSVRPVRQGASPAAQTSARGVPPTFIFSGETACLIDQMIQKYRKRLARENVLVFRLDESSHVLQVQLVTKNEAVEISGVAWGMLADLDSIYDGIIRWFQHLFISEELVIDGLQRYGTDVAPAALANALICERNERIEAWRRENCKSG